MPKAKAAKPNKFANLPSEALVDEMGVIKAQVDDLETRRRELQFEVLTRAAAEKLERVDGNVFSAKIVAAFTVASLDRAKLEEEMGEEWCTKYLKWSIKSAHCRISSRGAGK